MGLLKKRAQVPSGTTEDFQLYVSEGGPASLLVDDGEPALSEDDHESPVEETFEHTPLGVESIRVGVTVKISKSYNTYETHFSAEADPRLSSADKVQTWVRQQCYKQLSHVLTDLNVQQGASKQ